MFYKEILIPVLDSIEKFSTRNAFFINGTPYTYHQLGECISKIRTVIDYSGHQSAIVGLVINDDLETYASIFALWLSGNSYVPLHPGWPLDRCQDIINQIETDLVVDSSKETRYKDIHVISTKNIPNSPLNLSPLENVSNENLAYILFTSGSTGKPKGVQISRRNVGAFMDSFWKTGITTNENDRCLQCFDLTFDVSVQSYLVALTKGACCYTIPYGQIKYIYASSLIEEEKITFGAMAPSMLRYLQPYFDEMDATSLKTCILTAEACPIALIEEWYN